VLLEDAANNFDELNRQKQILPCTHSASAMQSSTDTDDDRRSIPLSKMATTDDTVSIQSERERSES